VSASASTSEKADMVIFCLSSVFCIGTVRPGAGTNRTAGHCTGTARPGAVLGPYGRALGPTVRPGAVLGPYGRALGLYGPAVLSTNGSTVTAFHCVFVGWNT